MLAFPQDLLLPAFASKGYLTSTASSSIGAALISRLPILGHTTLTGAYTYLDTPAQVLQPTTEAVMDTIRALRIKSLAGDLPHAGAAAEMLQWDALLGRLYDENDRLWDIILARPLVDVSTLSRPSSLEVAPPVGPSAEQLALEAEEEEEKKRAVVRSADRRGAA